MNKPILPPDHADRIARARLALDGLSVGDALGEMCFHPDNFDAVIEDPRATPRGPWPWTDDTAMALGIFEVLGEYGQIHQDALARRFAARFVAQPYRGYGPGAFRLLGAIAGGADWREAAQALFGGGSFGNGSAMRIAPLAGYFADDTYETIVEQSRLSARITHAHAEGIAGAIAAAVAGAYAWKNRDQRDRDTVKRGLFEVVLTFTPESTVREGIARAAALEFDTEMDEVVPSLGNGRRISCQDTVPYCLWAAARNLDDYERAIVNTIRVGGDIDTNAAIVGGIVGLAVGREGIPPDWLNDREQLVV